MATLRNDSTGRFDGHTFEVNVYGSLTTGLFVTVVPAVVLSVTHGPQRDTAIVCFAGKLCVVVTSVRRTHCKQQHTSEQYKTQPEMY